MSSPLRTLFVSAILLLSAAPAAFAGPPPHQGPTDPGKGAPELRLDAGCSGDTVSGTLSMLAPAGESYSVGLSYRPKHRATWLDGGHSSAFQSDGTRRTYDYSFDVSALDAFAYRLSVDGEHTWSKTLPASSCAPGRQVPEAPLALLLPLSLLGTAAAFLARGRLRLGG